MNAEQEKVLRENIKQLIEVVKQKKENKVNEVINEEKRLRKIIRDLVDYELKTLKEASTPDNEPTPNKSTGINVLGDLLKKIIPVLDTDYKLLTTDPEQRISFRSHIINAVIGALTPAEANTKAGDAAAASREESLEEAIDIDIGDPDEDKFIDIRTDAEKSSEDEAEPEPDPREEFGVDGEDETGRNVAYNAFKKIESSVVDGYELLGNTEDQELFYDYLIANLKLYFDNFEDELTTQIEEPTNQAYQDATAEADEMEGAPSKAGGEEELELEL